MASRQLSKSLYRVHTDMDRSRVDEFNERQREEKK